MHLDGGGLGVMHAEWTTPSSSSSFLMHSSVDPVTPTTSSALTALLSSPSEQMSVCCPSPLNSPHSAFLPHHSSSHHHQHQHQQQIFQFPPPLGIKEEYSTAGQQQHLGQSSTLLQDLSSPGPASLPSPMAISPTLSTLNTPRNSITSIRSSHEQQTSPMHTDGGGSSMTTSSASCNASVSAVTVASASASAFAPASQHGVVDGVPTAASAHSPSPFLEVPSSSAGGICFDDPSSSSYYYNSPPRSPYAASPANNLSSSTSSYPHPPPSYEEYMQQNSNSANAAAAAAATSVIHQDPSFCSAADSSTFPSADASALHPDLPLFAHLGAAKQEPDYTDAASPALVHGGGSGGFVTSSHPHSVVSSTPDLLSDTCPETPDSSVREESAGGGRTGGNSALLDTGKYICLWVDCEQEFDAQKSLVEHVTETHVESAKKGCEERPCLWKDCPRKLKPFNAKYKLSTHMRVHTKEKPYKCEFDGCKRAFARLENRKIHMRSHTGQKPFPCKFQVEFNCSKRFSNSSDRAKHEQTHKDPKPYRCEVLGCTKRYTDPSSLRKHVKSHTHEEQQQYRRVKDQINLQKQVQIMQQQQQQQQQQDAASMDSSTWQQASPAQSDMAAASPGAAASAAPSASASTLLAVGLQAGGTIVDMHDENNGDLNGGADPIMISAAAHSSTRIDEDDDDDDGEGGQAAKQQQHFSVQQQQQQQAGPVAVMQHQQQPGALQAQKTPKKLSYNVGAGLSHQPNSLDDLDPSDAILPFDDVPVRYEQQQQQQQEQEGFVSLAPSDWCSAAASDGGVCVPPGIEDQQQI